MKKTKLLSSLALSLIFVSTANAIDAKKKVGNVSQTEPVQVVKVSTDTPQAEQLNEAPKDLKSKQKNLYFSLGINSNAAKATREYDVTNGSIRYSGSSSSSARSGGIFGSIGMEVSVNEKFYISPEIFVSANGSPTVKTEFTNQKTAWVDGTLYGALLRFGYNVKPDLKVNIITGLTHAKTTSQIGILKKSTEGFYQTYGAGLSYSTKENFNILLDITGTTLGSNKFTDSSGYLKDSFTLTQVKLGLVKYIN
jgi:opacity protein-like surface antigen